MLVRVIIFINFVRMKFLVRFFITLYIFLAGFSQVDAREHKDHAGYSPIKNLIKSENAVCVNALFEESPVFTSTHSLQAENYKFKATDNEGEEDELSSSKKSLDLNTYFVTNFNAQAPVSFYHADKKCVPASEHFFHFSSYRRYIIYRVIRI